VQENDWSDRPDDIELLQQMLALIGEKWTIPILVTLSNGRFRFNELHRAIGGISQRMLAVTLRMLERDGLLIRTVHPTVPARVEYELSDRGHSLKEALQPIIGWVLKNKKALEETRRSFDRSRSRSKRWHAWAI
jgi:DNA-binding HxlR family transcriptional regulator